MKRILSLVVACLLLPTVAAAADSLAGRKPNIVFLLTDDQGYGDISAHGNPVLKTPNLDRLHDEGVRFTDFQVSPTCSPTRSALHSGRHEFKNGVTHTILERERMALDTITLPAMLKTAGYTTGIFGKWHLGDEAEYQPNRRGYDEVFIHGAGGIGQSYPGSCGDAPDNKYFDPAILHNGKFEKTTGYCTDVFFAQATKWIDSVRGKQPFFCYIPTNAPHGPYICRDEDLARYSDKVDDDQAAHFLGMVSNIDDNVGKLLAKLKEWGIENDTLFVFMNDNGGTAGCKVFNAGMRAQKGSPYRGGVRASSFWRWPGTLKPAECDRMAAHIDFFPTLMDIAGITPSAELQAQWDGRSLLPLLVNPTADWQPRYLVTHVGRWPKGANANDYEYSNCSIRNKQYTLVSPAKGLGERSDKNWELYDLTADPGQTTNIAAKHPDVVKELEAAYDAWWKEVEPRTLENQLAAGPPVNPFKEIYWAQFGGGPGPVKSVREKAKAVAAADPKPSDDKSTTTRTLPKRGEPNPALAPITDDPKLPRVLLIGDSISIGYTLDVRERLKWKVNVHRIPANGGPTTNGLKNMSAWLGAGKWDLIHFNWGLHDLKYMEDGKKQVSPEDYEKNLRELVKQMKATGATLVWCSTTPVPEGDLKPMRKNDEVELYNRIAKKIMLEEMVAIDDLYSFALPRLKEIQLPVNVHFSDYGSAVLATQVATAIEQFLPRETWDKSKAPPAKKKRR